MVKKIRKPKSLIGWREFCDMPALGLSRVRAKIDTGARTSALHAEDIKFITRSGVRFVKFKVRPFDEDKSVIKSCAAPLVTERIIISSNGEREKRPVISTNIKIGPHVFVTEITLTARHEMNFPMLLGRRALRAGRFVVEPAKSYLITKR
jgi:hypothetical protein